MLTLEFLVLIQACSVWFLTGLIWVIQVVHYPLMAKVGEEGWLEYERSHMVRITWIVAPAMLIEAACCVLCLTLVLTSDSPQGTLAQSPLAHATLMVLLLAVWCSTWLLQVPAHQRLSAGFDTHTIRKLVMSNWARTIAWSARSVLLGFMLYSLIMS